MRHIAAALAITSALAFSGCANDPQGILAGQSAQALVCGLSAQQAAVTGIETSPFRGSKPLVDKKGQAITNLVFAATPIACQLIGGILAASAPVTVASSTPVVTAPVTAAPAASAAAAATP